MNRTLNCKIDFQVFIYRSKSMFFEVGLALFDAVQPKKMR